MLLTTFGEVCKRKKKNYYKYKKSSHSANLEITYANIVNNMK